MSASGAATKGKELSLTEKRQSALVGLIQGRTKKLGALLPRHMDEAMFVRKALYAIAKNAQIAECDPITVVSAITEAASLGLDPTGQLGDGYLVPYSVKGRMVCTFIVGYRGYVSLARRSGQLVSIEAHPVFEGDRFECTLGLSPNIVHAPAWDSETFAEPMALRFAYAVAKLRDDAFQFEVLARKEIDRIRASSKSVKSDYSPWNLYYIEMAKKTAIRRLAKLLPMSTEFGRALALEDSIEAEEVLTHPDVTDLVHLQEGAPSRVASVRDAVATRAAAADAKPDAPESDDERVAREMREAAEAEEARRQ